MLFTPTFKLVKYMPYWLPGVITGLIALVVALMNNYRLKQQQIKQIELDKELAEHKSYLEGINYKYKVIIDNEFQVYRKLSILAHKLYISTTNLFPFKSSENNNSLFLDINTNTYEIAGVSYNNFMTFLIANASFIPKTIHDKYIDFMNFCRLNLDFYNSCMTELGGKDRNFDNFEGSYQKALEQSEVILQKYIEVISAVREHIGIDRVL